MSIYKTLRMSALLALTVFAATRSMGITIAAVNDYDIAQTPLFVQNANEEPLMMLVMSRDEQLFNKAYPDYSDLDGDGLLDTTYNDKFDYSGYFDSNLCYQYDKSSNTFAADKEGVGANRHYCNGNRWSGNFMNWLSMSRLDIVRSVLYGGKRITDTADKTVIERAEVPNDLHAWVKVYAGGDINSLTPLGSGAKSFCNATVAAGGAPLLRVADGSFPEWSATALRQCGVGRNSDEPRSVKQDLVVRVDVCTRASGHALNESFCRTYGGGSTARTKPAGLLQLYAEDNRLRFGLIAGTDSRPRSGGMLRRNIGKLANNVPGQTCRSGDEFNTDTGVFCTASATTGSVIKTIDSFRIAQNWNYNDKWTDCDQYSILNRMSDDANGIRRRLNNPGAGGNGVTLYPCSAWGNPITEMYAEALRYITDGSANTSYIGESGAIAWLDPYNKREGGSSFCAQCSVLMLSSGSNSFDTDELGTLPGVIGNAATATDAVGAAENFVGSYVLGRVVATQNELNVGNLVNTHTDLCEARNASGQLSRVRGVCPDSPSVEGGYLVAGLAHRAYTQSVRTGLPNQQASDKVNVRTYAVSLAESLPTFDLKVGTNTIGLTPLCQANNSGSATATTGGWRSCSLGSVSIGEKVSANNVTYGMPLRADGTAGSFSLVWEDSLWGNDHDNDVVSMLSYCVGGACSSTNICRGAPNSGSCTGGNPNVMANEVLVRIENLSAYAGNAMLTGFQVSGSNNDGNHRVSLRPGSRDGSKLTDPNGGNLAYWTAPQVLRFRASGGAAKRLNTPLWYAAKYSNFDDANNNNLPDSGEWDKDGNGDPDNFFFARDPAKLRVALNAILSDAAAQGTNNSGGATSGARLSTDTYTLETSFTVKDAQRTDWFGVVRALRVDPDTGQTTTELWNAESKLPAFGARRIFATLTPTLLNSAGMVSQASVSDPFLATNVTLASLGLTGGEPWLGGNTLTNVVDYLRGQPSTTLRRRTALLGDIVNSTPVIVSRKDDYGYSLWSASLETSMQSYGNGYTTFQAARSNNASLNPMVYIGMNDGMLHGFDSSASATAGGRERFAYIPSASLQMMGELANPLYSHRYYMDGAISVSDVAFGPSNWRSVLVASMGAGGRSVSALDITNPTGFDEDNVLWELNAQSDADIGYVMGKPLIVPIMGGTAANPTPRWVALFGNGPNSHSGAPILFVVDIQTGRVLKKLRPANTPSRQYDSRNGLMSIAPVDLIGTDKLVDVVYGADLQGNVWKYDLSSRAVADWKIGLGGEPLFTAMDSSTNPAPQPITGELDVTRSGGVGVRITFGTGKYFETKDNIIGSNTQIQSLYAITDKCGANLACTAVIAGRSALSELSITESGGIREVTGGDYTLASTGWVIDMTRNSGSVRGERFIGTPRLQNGKVFMTTFQPEGKSCEAGGVNWLYALNLMTGGGGLGGVSTNPDGTGQVCTGNNCTGVSLNPDNVSAPVKEPNILIPQKPPGIICPAGDPDCAGSQTDLMNQLSKVKCSLIVSTPGAPNLYLPRPCGRQSWRQLQ